MSAIPAVRESIGEAVERVMIAGDLAKLTPEERIGYYRSVCESVGLNPLTRPLEYITLNGKLTLYARKDATDQLRSNNQVSIVIVGREVVEGCYVVTARATLPSGRTDESIGAVPIDKLMGEAKCNALMKCETKAKRRVTLSVCGMGLLDETEVETIPGAKIGETTAKVTEKPITFGTPKDATLGTVVKEGGPTASGGDVSNLAEGHDSPKTAPTFSSDEPSTLDQQQKFAMAFRDALPEKFRAHAEQLRRAALMEEGYAIDGIGTSKAIPKKDFGRIANKLIRAAKAMTEPFIPSDDDLPNNI